MTNELNYQNILVPVDGSAESEAALARAIQVTRRNGDDARLVILHVIDTRSFQNVTDFKTTMLDEVTVSVEKTLAKYTEQAEAAGVKHVKAVIQYGSAKNIIAEEAPEEFDIDLIMIGATGLNTIERILIGSVTEYVVRTAAVDTMVVRTGTDK